MKAPFLYKVFVLLQLQLTKEAIGRVKEEFDNLIFFIPDGVAVNKTANKNIKIYKPQ